MCRVRVRAAAHIWEVRGPPSGDGSFLPHRLSWSGRKNHQPLGILSVLCQMFHHIPRNDPDYVSEGK